jgi:hypothetical protein
VFGVLVEHQQMRRMLPPVFLVNLVVVMVLVVVVDSKTIFHRSHQVGRERSAHA